MRASTGLALTCTGLAAISTGPKAGPESGFVRRMESSVEFVFEQLFPYFFTFRRAVVWQPGACAIC